MEQIQIIDFTYAAAKASERIERKRLVMQFTTLMRNMADPTFGPGPDVTPVPSNEFMLSLTVACLKDCPTPLLRARVEWLRSSLLVEQRKAFCFMEKGMSLAKALILAARQ